MHETQNLLKPLRPLASVCALVLATGCLGNASDSDQDPPSDTKSSIEQGLVAPADPTPHSRDAVDTTVATNAACVNIKNFYYEIGYGGAPVKSASVGTGYKRDTVMDIASSSKWLYTSYYLQVLGGPSVPAAQVPFLNFTSGYANIDGTCLGDTVASCNTANQNEAPGYRVAKPAHHYTNDSTMVGRFDYNSGHLEYHAEHWGELASDKATALGDAIRAPISGDTMQLSYINPLMAGGGRTSVGDYAIFLQKVLRDELYMHDALGTNQTCTTSYEYSHASAGYTPKFNEPCNAGYSPWWPATSGKLADTTDTSEIQNVHYSLGHWVEEDGAFSSPGVFGFYPWIDKTKTWYGVIGRRAVYPGSLEQPDASAYAQSVMCGQAIRAAWFDGTPH